MTLAAFTDDLRPRLEAKADLRLDPITGKPVLLYPEGLLELNDSAHAIVSLCDGTRSLSDILDHLAGQFETTPDELRADVMECLQDLQKRQLIALVS